MSHYARDKRLIKQKVTISNLRISLVVFIEIPSFNSIYYNVATGLL